MLTRLHAQRGALRTAAVRLRVTRVPRDLSALAVLRLQPPVRRGASAQPVQPTTTSSSARQARSATRPVLPLPLSALTALLAAFAVWPASLLRLDRAVLATCVPGHPWLQVPWRALFPAGVVGWCPEARYAPPGISAPLAPRRSCPALLARWPRARAARTCRTAHPARLASRVLRLPLWLRRCSALPATFALAATSRRRSPAPSATFARLGVPRHLPASPGPTLLLLERLCVLLVLLEVSASGRLRFRSRAPQAATAWRARRRLGSTCVPTEPLATRPAWCRLRSACSAPPGGSAPPRASFRRRTAAEPGPTARAARRRRTPPMARGLAARATLALCAPAARQRRVPVRASRPALAAGTFAHRARSAALARPGSRAARPDSTTRRPAWLGALRALLVACAAGTTPSPRCARWDATAPVGTMRACSARLALSEMSLV